VRATTVLILLWVPAALGQALPGTAPLTIETDFADRMLDGMDRWLLRELAASPARRDAHSGQAEEKRKRFAKIIGLADRRIPFESPLMEATLTQPALVAETRAYKVWAIRWPVLDGMDGAGLLLEPREAPVARVVALPDADWTPEMVSGIAAGVPAHAQFARRLAENRCLVLVPVLVDRQPVGQYGPASRRPTNQTRREFIYRMAFQMGRHIAGYEVQKVLAAVDWFVASAPKLPTGVIGYGEGGLVALYSAAADRRIDATVVSGYFRTREEVWKEPVYRNVWGLLTEFGDAELATLIAPRALIVEASRGPDIPGPPPESKENGSGAAPGAILPPPLDQVRAEFERAARSCDGKCSLVESSGTPGSEATLRAFLRAMGSTADLNPPGPAPVERRTGFDPVVRQRRQFRQMVDFTQMLVRAAPNARAEFWSKANPSSVESWNRTKEPYRRHLWEEVLGKLPPPSEPLAAQTRRLYDEPKFIGYEVQMPLWPDVFAYGVLLVPRDLKPGERRPVVVTQHGRAGRPQDLVKPSLPRTESVYKKFAAQLADRGFVVYAPQNPYIFEERYRYIQRKANPMKWSLFSFILAQHERTLDWLTQLPFVDPNRIGFYGLSYGGKTASRVPPLLDRYALAISSGDFNEYTGKMAAIDRADSFMFTIEHEMYEFDFGNTFNYSETATLMAPRPFMVERGHRDGVAFDEWTAHEYAKVRRFYAFLGIPDRTAIEWFNGVHEIHAVETFRFLHKQLNWPEPQP
jgi:dienelactone hydrolase